MKVVVFNGSRARKTRAGRVRDPACCPLIRRVLQLGRGPGEGPAVSPLTAAVGRTRSPWLPAVSSRQDNIRGVALDTVLPPSVSHLRVPAVRGLFQKHVSGDDAIFRLAQLRFAESGMAAELYADTPEQLERELGFLPHHPDLPVVHLNRQVNPLHEDAQSLIEAFIRQFRGRLLGLVIHDQAEMASQIPEVVSAMHKVTAAGGRSGGPIVFIEYAAGMEPESFVELAQQLAEINDASVCIDIGHIGIRESRRRLKNIHPKLDLGTLCREAGRAPELIHDVQRATRSSLEVVLDMIRSLGSIGKPLHFHLHDGHPLIPGLADHFSFLIRLPVPIAWEGRYSLEPMYGLHGLTQVLAAIARNCPFDRSSITLEIHQSEGRIPLGNAAKLFARWEDVTNAERMNYWLSVLTENYTIATTVLDWVYARSQTDLV
jgi:hypothetical protein